MKNSYIAVKGERLDTIVQKVLGDLNKFEEVLKNNPHLQDKFLLANGDIVNFKIAVKNDFSVTLKESQVEDGNIVNSVLNTIEITFKTPLIPNNIEENLKALW